MSNRIRPLQGEVLVYMDPPDASKDGIVIPEKHQERSQFGEVRRMGIWRQAKKSGALIPYTVKPGDRVMIYANSGRWLHSEQERLKLVPEDRILAVLEKD